MKVVYFFLNILEWCESLGSKIAYDKTNVLHVCVKHNCDKSIISINNNVIKYVNSLQILGVHIN